MVSRKVAKGFTLIELLVVVGIIGLLSSVVLVAVFSGRSRARDGRRKADIKQIQGALELYFNANNTYPNTSSAWQCGPGGAALGLLPPNYLPVLPVTQPGAPGDGTYCYKSTAINYKLRTPLENSDVDSQNDGGNLAGEFELFTGGAVTF